MDFFAYWQAKVAFFGRWALHYMWNKNLHHNQIPDLGAVIFFSILAFFYLDIVNKTPSIVNETRFNLSL